MINVKTDNELDKLLTPMNYVKCYLCVFYFTVVAAKKALYPVYSPENIIMLKEHVRLAADYDALDVANKIGII